MSDNKGWAEVSPSPLLLLLLSLWPSFLLSLSSASFPTSLLFFFRPYFSSPPPRVLRCFTSSSSLFSVSSSFFVVFVVLIPRDDRGVVYMLVLEKLGGFGGFVATGLGRFEHAQNPPLFISAMSLVMSDIEFLSLLYFPLLNTNKVSFQDECTN